MFDFFIGFLKTTLILLEIALYTQYLMVRRYGKELLRDPSAHTKKLHGDAAKWLLTLSCVVVAVVLLLEVLLRKESGYIAPFNPVFAVHLPTALLYFLCIPLMIYWIHGKKWLWLHKPLGMWVVPILLGVMLATGTILVVRM